MTREGAPRGFRRAGARARADKSDHPTGDPRDDRSFVAFVQQLGYRLTPAQRTIARVAIDRIDPIDLPTKEERDLARLIFGPIDRVPPAARGIVALVLGARSGKTLFFEALAAVWSALTADLSTLAPGEIASALLVDPDLRLARLALRYASGTIKRIPALSRCLRGETQDSITLQRPDGSTVAIECLPKSEAGRSLRGRSFALVSFGESAFFLGSDAAISDADLLSSVAPRVLAGGLVILSSTPWSQAGLLFELFQKNWANPRTALVAHASTETMRPDARTKAIVDRERERDPSNAAREFDAVFAASGGDLLDRATIESCVDGGVTSRAPIPGGRYVIGLDLGVRHDASAIVVCHRALYDREGGAPIDAIVVDAIAHFRPGVVSKIVGLGRGRVDLDEVEREIVRLSRAFNGATVLHDSHLADLFAPRLRNRGVRCKEIAMHPSAQATRASLLLQRAQSGRLRLLDHPAMVKELSELRIVRHAGGRIAVSAPEGRKKHDDLADALLVCLEAAVELPPCGGDVEVEYGPVFLRFQTAQPLSGGEARYFRRLANGDRVPVAPPAGSQDHEAARAGRFAIGVYEQADLDDLGEEELARRLGFNVGVQP